MWRWLKGPVKGIVRLRGGGRAEPSLVKVGHLLADAKAGKGAGAKVGKAVAKADRAGLPEDRGA